ncbi:hypothetical protein LGQ02_19550 [Bacillus shivajii]|uniref:hypothetical protein n=1 Tax=Bacillus shivajii TaxID=1983719 RepID=UPI001CF9574D|nr:hypothetical protein [Bacillus shivajii]UCZ52949.1 hypothetical protein LGQ02_19550 [Bacillus shivajii]
MKGYIIHDNKFTKKIKLILDKLEDNSKIFVTDRSLYNELMEMDFNDIIFLDLFIETESEKKIELTNEIVKDIDYISENNYSYSPELLVNKIYNMICMIVNMVNQLEKYLKEYHINCLVIYGGSDSEQFLALTLAEGERPFRFLYKRNWFLNNFIYHSFKSKYDILWKNKTPSIYLKTLSFIKLNAISIGKSIFIIRKVLEAMRETKVTFKDSLLKYGIFVVRSPIQISPLVPIYREIEKRKEMTPIYLSFENYSNNKIHKEFLKHKVNNYNLYQLLTFSKLFKINKKIYYIKKRIKKRQNRDFYIFDNKISLDCSKLMKELTVYWFDTLVFNHLLNKFDDTMQKDLVVLINNETHGYHSALQTKWARQRKVPSVGIQHVSISDRLLPKISWNNVMFMMSNEIANKLNSLKSDEEFAYVGPISYDDYFNTSKHKNDFKVISIFTQPDDFKVDYFKIIEDIIEIIKKNEFNFDIKVKLHPREKDKKTFMKYKDYYQKLEIITDEVDSSTLISNSDLVLSIHSGTLMQAIFIGTPAISINYQKKHKIKFDFIQDDVTTKVFSKQELENQLKNLRVLNGKYFINRKKYLKYKLGDYQGDAASRVYDYIMNFKSNSTIRE